MLAVESHLFQFDGHFTILRAPIILRDKNESFAVNSSLCSCLEYEELKTIEPWPDDFGTTPNTVQI